MVAISAGILLYHGSGTDLRVLLVHPGGPFWARRDLGAWSIPKGEFGADEDPAAAARREFLEELGVQPPGELRPLGEIIQKAGKRVVGFACEGDLDVSAIVSNSFEMEWPPKSGRSQAFPEVDRAEWFDLATARQKIIPGQVVFLGRLESLCRGGSQA
jgi:predicted NUDIX family NTP pyrophosphohydrolase